VCFHPARGEGAGLGVLCDGCDISELYTGITFLTNDQPSTIDTTIQDTPTKPTTILPT